jgi:hypothetical protein
MLVRSYYSPRARGHYQHGQAQIKICQPMAGASLGIFPKGWASSPVFGVPVHGFEIRRKLTGCEFLLPTTEGELVKVSDQDIVQHLIGEVSLYASPVLFKVIVLHALRLGYDGERRG